MKKLSHVAIIMDGNGRWAQQKNKPRAYGHVKGTRVAKKIITHAADKGIQYLTLYAFSAENWLRPSSEVDFLMNLLGRYLKRETENLFKKNIKFSAIGQLEKLPQHIRTAMNYAIERTKNCTGLELCFAMSYGSRQEITEAVKKIAQDVENKKIRIEEIDDVTVHRHLMTAVRPDPDLVIRTSGEYRLSNFLMWQCAYSELLFSHTLWPDYTVEEFDLACLNYLARDRRFGRVESTSDVELSH